MTQLRYVVLIFSLLLAACAPLTWQQPAWVSAIQRPGVDPFVQNQQLGRGINLGNALEAPYEGAWGVTLYEDYFTAIADGFQHVRVPIRWNAHALAAPPYTIDPDFFARIDWVVTQATQNNLLVVLNIHHYEEMFTDHRGHRERFLALWRQIAEHYSDASDSVLFELLNEPHDELTSFAWNEMIPDVIATIRASNPTRNLIVGPGNWYNISQLYTLALPPDDKHLIVSVHYYEPFHFTHQGADWVSGSAAWLGTTWSSTNSQRGAVEADLGQAARWGKENGYPIYLGEFGAYSRADMESRVQYTGFVARTAESLGISWAYWEFGAGFGAYERGTGTWKQALLGALIPQP
ncbi:MAG: glycoside hydrolase family 5 protein [Chloroflexi bacterium]|nr:MAG: glycoside hydrolase family 5 protein [Chloroflexota bacterium]